MHFNNVANRIGFLFNPFPLETQSVTQLFQHPVLVKMKYYYTLHPKNPMHNTHTPHFPQNERNYTRNPSFGTPCTFKNTRNGVGRPKNPRFSESPVQIGQKMKNLSPKSRDCRHGGAINAP